MGILETCVREFGEGELAEVFECGTLEILLIILERIITSGKRGRVIQALEQPFRGLGCLLHLVFVSSLCDGDSVNFRLESVTCCVRA
jgi:hypothetical protein